MDTPAETDKNIEFTETEIRELTLTARQMENKIQGRCYEICHNLGNILIDRGLPHTGDPFTVEHVRVGENNDEKHFIMKIDGKYIEGTTAGEEVYIDTSLDQFCDENKKAGDVTVSFGSRESLQKVYIYFPDDPRREQYGDFEELLESEL